MQWVKKSGHFHLICSEIIQNMVRPLGVLNSCRRVILKMRLGQPRAVWFSSWKCWMSALFCLRVCGGTHLAGSCPPDLLGCVTAPSRGLPRTLVLLESFPSLVVMGSFGQEQRVAGFKCSEMLSLPHGGGVQAGVPGWGGGTRVAKSWPQAWLGGSDPRASKHDSSEWRSPPGSPHGSCWSSPGHHPSSRGNEKNDGTKKKPSARIRVWPPGSMQEENSPESCSCLSSFSWSSPLQNRTSHLFKSCTEWWTNRSRILMKTCSRNASKIVPLKHGSQLTLWAWPNLLPRLWVSNFRTTALGALTLLPGSPAGCVGYLG